VEAAADAGKLAAAAITLIRALPDDGHAASAQELEAIAALYDEVLRVVRSSVAQMEAIPALSAWEQQARRLLDAQRAGDALTGWAKRAGMPGLPEVPGPSIIEAPDGSVTVVLPKREPGET
jgi:hypothetical protein